MKLIDTHCHLNFADAFPNVEDTLARAAANGVSTVIVVGCDTITSEQAVRLSEQFDSVYACVGWHPNYSADYTKADLRAIASLARHKKVVAIGEIGFDNHWQNATHDQQYACTADHLALAADMELTTIFHCREAYNELLTFLEKAPRLPKRLVLHCFSGTREQAQKAVRLGCWFGVDGPVTYPKADSLRTTIASLPRDRILLETDSPYLAPHPFRGKPNEPALLPLVNSEVARLFHMTPQESAALTTNNAITAFALTRG